MDKPTFDFGRSDGNVFSLVGGASRALNNAGQRDEAKKMQSRVLNAGSYDEALQIIMEYVEFDSSDDSDAEWDAEWDAHWADMDEDKVFPHVRSVAIAIPVSNFFSEEDELLDSDRMARAMAYAEATAATLFPNAVIQAFEYDSTSPHGSQIDGLTLDEEADAYDALGWIEREADDTE